MMQHQGAKSMMHLASGLYFAAAPFYLTQYARDNAAQAPRTVTLQRRERVSLPLTAASSYSTTPSHNDDAGGVTIRRSYKRMSRTPQRRLNGQAELYRYAAQVAPAQSIAVTVRTSNDFARRQ